MLVVEIDDLGIEYRDVGPWRSYSLYASGYSLEELEAGAWIFETDQDGRELRGYPLGDAPSGVYIEAMDALARELRERSIA